MTWSAWIRRVRSVTSAVTVGLPSRSPPIHVPQRRNAGTRGGRVPVRPLSAAGPPRVGRSSRAASIARYRRGTSVNSVASKNAIAVRTSSSGEGTTVRRSEVRHTIVISSRSRRRISASSAGVRRGSSSRSSNAAIRRSATSSVRRRASVGCAVRTGEITSRSIAWSSSSSVRPSRRSRRIASASDRSSTPLREARARRASARTRCRSSARFTSWK